jgi:hypothetical protein
MTLPNTPSQAPTPAPASATPPESTPAQPAETPEQPAEQPQYVTKEELAAAVELGVRRAQQSARDRSQKIEDQVKAITARLEKAGATVSPEITQNLRQQVEQELDTQTPDQPAAAAPGTPASMPGTGDPVYDWTMEAYKTEGIDIKPTDPEFALVKAALDDPAGNMFKYQRTVMRAIDTKRERTAASQNTADARVLGGSNQPPGQAQPKTSTEAWEQAYRK